MQNAGRKRKVMSSSFLRERAPQWSVRAVGPASSWSIPTSDGAQAACIIVHVSYSVLQKHPVAPFSVRAFCTISSSSSPLNVYFVWEKSSVFVQHAQIDVEIGLCFWKKIFRLGFHPILAENYVKFNIVWNRLCPHNLCHRVKIGKRKRGLRGTFIIISVQNLSKSVRI